VLEKLFCAIIFPLVEVPSSVEISWDALEKLSVGGDIPYITKARCQHQSSPSTLNVLGAVTSKRLEAYLNRPESCLKPTEVKVHSGINRRTLVIHHFSGFFFDQPTLDHYLHLSQSLGNSLNGYRTDFGMLLYNCSPQADHVKTCPRL
jgi:hypothetical protein